MKYMPNEADREKKEKKKTTRILLNDYASWWKFKMKISYGDPIN